MTDYLITMDNGEQYLVHYGIQGMKWGKWNAETAARYAGQHGGKMPSVGKARAKYAAKEGLITAAQIGTGIGAGVGAGLATGGNPVVGKVVAGGAFGASIGAANQKESKWKQDYHKEVAEGYRYKAYKTPNEAKKHKYNVKAEEHEAKYKDTVNTNTKLMDISASNLRNKASQATGKKADKLNRKAEKFENMSAKYKVDSKVSEAKDVPKWKQNGYNSEAEHRAAIERAKKQLGIQDATGYYDKPKSQQHQEVRKKNKSS